MSRATEQLVKDFIEFAQKNLGDKEAIAAAQRTVLEQMSALRRTGDVRDFTPIGYTPARAQAELRRLIDSGTLPDLRAAERTGLMPTAYKVVAEDGRSPWAPGSRMILPEQIGSNKYKPGPWQKAELNVELTRYDSGVVRQPGIYVTDSPLPWRDEAARIMDKDPAFILRDGSRAKPEIYVAELRGKTAKTYWLADMFRYNFRAEEARLVRPVTKEEEGKMPYRIG